MQSAAVAAFDDQEHVATQRAVYRERLEIGIAIFDAAGVDAVMPGGGFYLWAAAPDGDAWGLTRRLAERSGVVVAPGEFYGVRSDHVRFAAVQPTDALRLALERIRS